MPWESGGTAPVSASSQAKSASSGEREKPMLVSDTMEKPATTAKPATATGEAPTPQPNLAMLMPCPSCSSRISKRAELCPKCKEAPYNNCQVCSTKVLVNCGSCPECGDPDPFNA